MQLSHSATRTERTSRQSTDAVINCRPYASHGGTQQADGVMRNFSESGAYIETDRPFKRGTILIVRMVRYPKTGMDGIRSISLAEVRWRKERLEDGNLRYGMGLRYFS